MILLVVSAWRDPLRRCYIPKIRKAVMVGITRRDGAVKAVAIYV